MQTISTKEKRCNDCGETKPISEFGRRWNRRRTQKNWLTAFCKACSVVRTTAWVKKNRKKYNDYQREYWQKYLKK